MQIIITEGVEVWSEEVHTRPQRGDILDLSKGWFMVQDILISVNQIQVIVTQLTEEEIRKKKKQWYKSS